MISKIYKIFIVLLEVSDHHLHIDGTTILGFAQKYSLSDNIYTRYDLEGTIPSTLNSIKNDYYNHMCLISQLLADSSRL